MRITKAGWIMFLSLALALSLGLSSSFSSTDMEGPGFAFRACVLRKEGTNLLVYKEDPAAPDRVCIVPTGSASLTGSEGLPISADALEPGEIVVVTGRGVVLAVWPSIYQNVNGIASTGEKSGRLYGEGMQAAAMHIGNSG